MIAWFTRNGVAANLVMLILVIGGFMIDRHTGQMQHVQ